MVYLSVMKYLLISLLMLGLAACSAGTSGATPTIALPAPSATLAITPGASPAPTDSSIPSPLPVLTDTSSPPSPTPMEASPSPAPQAGFPDPNAYRWQSLVSGLDEPIGMAVAGDGSGRLFILEKPGRIRVIQDGVLSPTPFLDISDRVGSRGSEQGLLGLAFHPHYTENGHFYINYTDTEGNTVIASYRVSADDPNQADPRSEVRFIYVPQPYPNHNGGEVTFGPDGYLFLGLGDGGSAGDPQGNAQSLNTLLGKILRIDVDQGDPYRAPPDNPFVNTRNQPEIWAYGLRNPWRFSFDRQTGDLYIGDVGQNLWEEIDYLPAGSPGGANFGWSYYEGTHPYKGTPPNDLSPVMPVAEYSHDQGCSVTGGYVYRGANLPEWQGIYFFGDYCSGNVWGLRRNSSQGEWEQRLLYENVGRITSFGEDEQGELYLLDQTGTIYTLAKN